MALANVQEYDKDVQFNIGQRIQQARIEKGIAGIDLASYLNIGKNQMSRIENGKANCTLPQLYVLAQVLECSVDYLLFGKKTSNYTQEQEDSIKALLAAFTK